VVLKAFLRGGALVVASTGVWQCSNFVFNAAGARLLGPSKYGALAASISLLYLVGPVFVSIQTVASREATSFAAAGERAQLRYRLDRLSAWVGVSGGLLAAALIALSRPISGFLHIASPLPVILGALALPLLALTHLQRGVLQGTRRFGRYAASTVVEALSKLLVALVLFGSLWRDPAAGMLAVVIAAGCGLIVNAILLRFLPKGPSTAPRARTSSRYSAMVLATLVLLALLMSDDTLAAKRYLDPHAAGVYASVSVTGKIVFFATSALSYFLFPFFSARHEVGRDGRARLAAALGLVAGASCSLTLLFFVAPRVVMTAVLGTAYASVGRYLGWMGIAFGLYAVVYLVAMYLLAQRRADVVAVLAFVALVQLAAFSHFHASISQLIDVMIAAFSVAVVALVGAALLSRPPQVVDLIRTAPGERPSISESQLSRPTVRGSQ
jgi:O-antigen/teichoic acid export membrane protein